MNNNNEILVSIIIPVYNAAAYIDRGLEAVCKQTHSNIQIIIIDDGSKDASLEIVQKFQCKDRRIEVYSKSNGGVSSARNLGLEYVRGYYVAFIDIDDLIKADYIEKLLDDAIRHNSDIACCNCIQTEGNYKLIPLGKFTLVNSNRIIDNMVDVLYDIVKAEENYYSVVWCKLIKADLAQKVKFDSLCYGEDFHYMLKLLKYTPSFCLSNYSGYYYIRWQASATRRKAEFDLDRTIDRITVAQFFYNICQEYNEKRLIEISGKQLIDTIRGAIHASLANPYVVFKKDKERLLRFFSEDLYLKMSILDRTEVVCYKYLPALYWVLFSIIFKLKHM